MLVPVFRAKAAQELRRIHGLHLQGSFVQRRASCVSSAVACSLREGRVLILDCWCRNGLGFETVLSCQDELCPVTCKANEKKCFVYDFAENEDYLGTGPTFTECENCCDNRAELTDRCRSPGEREVCVAEDAKCPCGKMLGTVFVRV